MVVYRILADLVVIVHAALVGFVVLGFVLILAGIAARWSWVRNFYFRFLHLGTIVIVAAESILGAMCPLTTLENWLRERGGEAGYPGDFIAYWAHWLIFYDVPARVFTVLYVAFAALVLLTMILVPPRAAGIARRRH